MANDVSSVSVPMNNARFGRLLSDAETAELERRQRHYDAQERAAAAGLPPPTLDYDGNPLTVMKAWDERRAAERAERRRQAEEFLERERNRDHEVTPMEAIAEDLDNLGHRRTASLVRGLQLAEAAAAARGAGPMSGVELVSTRNTRAGTPVARRPVDATPAERAAFEEAISARNRGKRGRKQERAVEKEARSSGMAADAVRAGRAMPPKGGAAAPGNVPIRPLEFYGARKLGRATGTVGEFDIYDVPYTKEGQAALRAAVDVGYGPSAQPWCIVGRRPGEPEWNRYSSQHWTDMGAPDGRDGRVRFATRRSDGKIVAVETNYAGPGSGLVWNSLGNGQFSQLDDAAAHRGPNEFYKLRGFMSDGGLDPDMVPYDVQPAEAAQQDAKGGDTRADAKGGDASGSETAVSETAVSEPAPQDRGGPRIVINPTTFKNKKDALCVAFNEGFRLWMEANDFQPQSEPTDRQRRFFSDTAYADDELQLRRTILARVATFDTSVKDPTDDQLTETAQFLDGVLESGWCKNEWEQDCVSRLSQAVKAAIGAEPVEPREAPLEPAQADPLEPAGGEEVQALQSGGSTDDEEEDKFALQNSGQSYAAGVREERDLQRREAEQTEALGMAPDGQEQAQEPSADQGAPTVQPEPPDAPQAGKPAPQDDEPTDEQARQAEIQNEKDLAAATKEYDRMKASGKLDDSRAFGEAARPKPAMASPVDEGSPGSIAYRGPRKGDISQPIVGADSPGSIAYKGPRKGDISRPIVDAGSPGSMSFSGTRQGGMGDSIVDPGSTGSIAGPVASYEPGSIGSPVDDPRRKEERRKRRDRRRRGLL